MTMNLSTGFRVTTRHRMRMLRHELERLGRNFTATANQHPIIVLGNQKSGTSAIAALLGRATGKSVLIDLFFRFGRASWPILYGQRPLADIFSKSRIYLSHDIIKEPEFILFYDELREWYPGSKSLFVVRDPLTNIRSILSRLRLPGNQQQLESKQLHRALADHPLWLPVLEGPRESLQGDNYIEVLAKRWNYCASICLSNRSDLIVAKYEDFQMDKRPFIESLAAALNLEVSSDITPLLNKPYQRPGTQADPRAFFGEENVEIIARICSESALRLGYKSSRD